MLTSAAGYFVEVSPTGADRTNVTGTATLGMAAARTFRRQLPPVPGRPPEAGKTNTALARRSRSRQDPKAEAQPR